MSEFGNDKDKLVLTSIAVFVIGGMIAFGYQMFEHNNRVVEQFSNINIPDNEESSGSWIKYTGSNPCPIFVEQRFDANKSHYICMNHRG